jgi:catechol 2,3-dioxygenase-like lactoylglutathione lyase family enzyme
MSKGKLRHVAIQVPDLERAAKFYESTFGLERVASATAPIGDAVMLSDGTVNLTLLNFPNGQGGQLHGPDWAGLHHIGFVVDDEDVTAAKIEEGGGRFFMKLPAGYPGVDAESKYKDPFGVVFDISAHEWTLIKKQ